MTNKVNVLGTEYSIEYKDYDDDPAFAKLGIDGYCEQGTHKIVICDLHTFPGWEDETDEFIESNMKHTLRHEVNHCAMHESGLQERCNTYNGPWSRNESMIDWWAIQGPKVYKMWEEAGAL